MNFTSHYIGFHGIKIQSEGGYPISSINPIETLSLHPDFPFPFLVSDILKKREVKPVIKIIEPPAKLDFLDEVGIILYGIPIEKKDSWAKRQKYIYYLRPEEIPAEEDSVEVRKLPSNHYLEIDTANSKLRLHGTCISPEQNSTEWVFY